MADADLGRSSRVMALGTVASRLTGFLRSSTTAAALGVAALGNAYATAYTLPLIVYELLIGGVLTSTLVPILVRAQKEDADGGIEFEGTLVATLALLLLGLLVIGEVAAPWIVHLYGITDPAQAELTTMLTRLMLPCIFGYGLTAVFGAILNTRGVFGPQMWAPVLNNLVIIIGLGLFALSVDGGSLDPASISDTSILILGLGPVVGIIAQTAVLGWYLFRRTPFRWIWIPSPRHARIGQISSMASWMVVYVLATQFGNWTLTRVLNLAGSEGGPGYASWTLSQTIWQLPYAIVGVTLITVLLPRMSRAAAAGRLADVGRDLSAVTRLTGVVLMACTVWFIALGPEIATVIYAHGNTSVDEARDIGSVLAVTAIGLLPFATNMFQIRAFYSLQESRSPAIVNVLMQGLRSGLNVAAGLLAASAVIYGVAASFSVSLFFGAALSGYLLRRRIGSQDVRRIGWLLVRLVVAGAATWASVVVVRETWSILGDSLGLSPWLDAFVVLVVAGLVSGAVFLGAGLALRVTEVREVLSLLLGRFLPRALRP